MNIENKYKYYTITYNFSHAPIPGTETNGYIEYLIPDGEIRLFGYKFESPTLEDVLDGLSKNKYVDPIGTSRHIYLDYNLNTKFLVTEHGKRVYMYDDEDRKLMDDLFFEFNKWKSTNKLILDHTVNEEEMIKYTKSYQIFLDEHNETLEKLFNKYAE